LHLERSDDRRDRVIAVIGKAKPLINTDDTDLNPANILLRNHGKVLRFPDTRFSPCLRVSVVDVVSAALHF
jgi:hypothetical protein